ncbi:MAG: hypothetical protein SGI77_06990 [Pirellulaceae bacterium]|nr:hypothetical protein [Pirellulaceae bacterium]
MLRVILLASVLVVGISSTSSAQGFIGVGFGNGGFGPGYYGSGLGMGYGPGSFGYGGFGPRYGYGSGVGISIGTNRGYGNYGYAPRVSYPSNYYRSAPAYRASSVSYRPQVRCQPQRYTRARRCY